MHLLKEGIDLGGRSVRASSILSVRVEKRTSPELFGYIGLVGVCVLAAVLSRSLAISCAALFVGIVLLAAARREITHPYVMVIDIFQAGTFEVRGYHCAEILEVLASVEALRSGAATEAGNPLAVGAKL